MPHKVE